jgi:hypothetical protein
MADNPSSTGTWPPVEIVRRIYLIRSQRVMLATPNSTKCLNEALKRGLASEPAATGRHYCLGKSLGLSRQCAGVRPFSFTCANRGRGVGFAESAAGRAGGIHFDGGELRSPRATLRFRGVGHRRSVPDHAAGQSYRRPILPRALGQDRPQLFHVAA